MPQDMTSTSPKFNRSIIMQAAWSHYQACFSRMSFNRELFAVCLILGGRPVIAGTRITVRAIKSFGRAGFSVDHILQEYPKLTRDQIKAALSYEDKG